MKMDGILIDGIIDPKTNLEEVLGTCPSYLEKHFGPNNTSADLKKSDEKDPYGISISFNQYANPVNLAVHILAKDKERANQIAVKLQNKLSMQRVEIPGYNC
ncbi:hypothetical protein L6303_03000 [archaeon]|nr:hypothetical protein [Nanoarchaeota archaeon]MBU4300572.1 hypothetical protein [Nanoarchaeota archaeon]MBU4452268.1 hypothetical protein [Nanoarchaeota archaeon]MCG2723687.1 hypothetical protein [archaeon]